MATKNDVNLATYSKAPRHLSDGMVLELAPGGGLHAIVEAVSNDPDRALRLDIREKRFNIYHRGGSLLCVDGRRRPWAMSFDPRYFKDSGCQIPALPDRFTDGADARAWCDAFPTLREGMIGWWGRVHACQERADCQAIAKTNAARDGLPGGDYFVLDLEYQWAQRRFDLVALRRVPTATDPAGWANPVLTFVEVKSDIGPCRGSAGLAVHAQDYWGLVGAPEFQHERIRNEFAGVFRQKQALGLIDPALAMDAIAPGLPELLVVFVEMQDKRKEIGPLVEQMQLNAPGAVGTGSIRFLELSHPATAMCRANVLEAREFLKLCR